MNKCLTKLAKMYPTVSLFINNNFERDCVYMYVIFSHLRTGSFVSSTHFQVFSLHVEECLETENGTGNGLGDWEWAWGLGMGLETILGMDLETGNGLGDWEKAWGTRRAWMSKFVMYVS